MKFFIAFVALVAVAASVPHHKPLNHIEAELQAIIDAINSPSTDPATAILLQDKLDAILGISKPEEIDASPVIIEEPEEIDASPVIIDEVPEAVVPEPSSSPLVQIIINVNGGSSANSPVAIDRPEPQEIEHEVDPDPVIVVDEAEPVDPVEVAPIVPLPVIVMPDILN